MAKTKPSRWFAAERARASIRRPHRQLQTTDKKETAVKAVSISRVSARRVRSAPCLDDRRFSLANRSLALAPTTGEAKREYNRADDDYKLFHDLPPSEIHRKVSLLFH